MRIAILQRSRRHTEVFGFIMDFCKTHQIELDIYVQKYRFWYVPYLNSVLQTEYKCFDALTIKPETMKQYDYVIVTTGADVKSIRGYPNSRILYIHHLDGRHRCQSKNISLSPLVKNCTYLFPVYNGFTEVNKKDNIFMIIGYLKPRNMADIGRTLNKFKNANFQLYVFTTSEAKPKDKRVKLLRGASTEKIVEIIKKTKFLLSVPNPDSYYYKNRLTGELPLAFSHNLPICLPKKLNNIYKLKGVITYNKSISEVFERLLNMKMNEYSKLVNSLQSHRNEIMRMNHKKMRSLLKVKPEKKK